MKNKVKLGIIGTLSLFSIFFGRDKMIVNDGKITKTPPKETHEELLKATIVPKVVNISTSKNADTVISNAEKKQEKINHAKDKMCILMDKKEISENWFRKYKRLIYKYKDLIDMPETVYNCYNDAEIKYMRKCIETETYGADFESKTHVASVILNRDKLGNFGENVIEIITNQNQFAYGRDNITDSTKLALEYAFMIGDTSRDCIGFRSDMRPQTWNNWNYVFSDLVGHHFYK